MSIALALPEVSNKREIQRSIQLARTKDCVKVPAHNEFGGETINAKSNLFPEGFSPALIPDALKPEGAVMPPEIKDHVEDSKLLNRLPKKVNSLLSCAILFQF